MQTRDWPSVRRQNLLDRTPSDRKDISVRPDYLSCLSSVVHFPVRRQRDPFDHAMPGYLNDPENAAEVIVEMDGKRGYKTGNKGRLDSVPATATACATRSHVASTSLSWTVLALRYRYLASRTSRETGNCVLIWTIPIIDAWYHYPAKAQKFKVTALDDHAATVEIQYFDGKIDELDLDTWHGLDMERIEPPRGLDRAHG